MSFGGRPIFTDAFDDITALHIDAGSAFLYARSDEDRSEVDTAWSAAQADTVFVPFIAQNDHEQMVTIDLGVEKTFGLRSEVERHDLLHTIGRHHLYIDITGLNDATWAPILKAALDSNIYTTVLYQEPEAYKARRGTEQQTRFELSVGRGLGPLPGFERYEPTVGTISAGTIVRDGRLMVLMGFEGDRFGHLLANQEFDPDRVFPVIGLPGFRLEFVAHALLGNQRPMVQVMGQARLRYAPAHCPFAIAYLIEEMLEEERVGTLMVAPIGTKPHAVGAVLAAIAAPERIEIIYDHPQRTKGRSHGKGRTFVYDITAFMNQWSLLTRTDITHLEISPRRW